MSYSMQMVNQKIKFVNEPGNRLELMALFEEIMDGNFPELKRKIKTSHYVQNWIN